MRDHGSEVGFNKRNKKVRNQKHTFDQESDQEKRKEKKKEHALDKESDQEKQKTITAKRKNTLSTKNKKKKLYFFLIGFFVKRVFFL